MNRYESLWYVKNDNNFSGLFEIINVQNTLHVNTFSCQKLRINQSFLTSVNAFLLEIHRECPVIEHSNK